MTDASAGLAQSIQVRLVRHAKILGVDPNLILIRFAMERFLYRLSRSPEAERFVLKGGLLLLVWLGENIRPTRDADLLGLADLSDGALTRIFSDVCTAEVEPDAMTFLPDSIRIEAIRADDPYGGKRVTLKSRLGPARLRVQVDIGIGDAVFPEPVWIDYPSLLDLPRAHLRAYRPETAIAEKFHAMVTFGSNNSRMRDFFDIDALAARQSFEGQVLVDAVRVTFKSRRTGFPSHLPIALTPAFSASSEKQAQWAGFVRKNGLTSAPADLGKVVERLAGFLVPVMTVAERGTVFNLAWPPGGPWGKRP